jgi:hypothetical protein
MLTIQEFAPQSKTGGYRLDEILAIAEVALAYANNARDVNARRGMAAWELLREIAYGDVLVATAKAEGALDTLFGRPMPKKGLTKADVRLYGRGQVRMAEKMAQWSTDSQFARVIARA